MTESEWVSGLFREGALPKVPGQVILDGDLVQVVQNEIRQFFVPLFFNAVSIDGEKRQGATAAAPRPRRLIFLDDLRPNGRRFRNRKSLYPIKVLTFFLNEFGGDE